MKKHHALLLAALALACDSTEPELPGSVAGEVEACWTFGAGVCRPWRSGGDATLTGVDTVRNMAFSGGMFLFTAVPAGRYVLVLDFAGRIYVDGQLCLSKFPLEQVEVLPGEVTSVRVQGEVACPHLRHRASISRAHHRHESGLAQELPHFGLTITGRGLDRDAAPK